MTTYEIIRHFLSKFRYKFERSSKKKNLLESNIIYSKPLQIYSPFSSLITTDNYRASVELSIDPGIYRAL